MARLPTVDSFGARPIPRSQRGVSAVRNAGAVGDAVSQVGAAIAGEGERRLEQEDRISYGAARSLRLRADVTARQAFQDDPDYGTMEARYIEGMKKANESAQTLVRSRADRRMFEIDAQADLDRGLAEVRNIVRTKRVAADTGLFLGSMETLRGTVRDAADDKTREAVFNEANSNIEGAVARGLIDPVKAFQMRREFVSSTVVERASQKIDANDPDGAEAIVRQHAGFLDSDTAITLNRQIDKLRDDKAWMGAVDIVAPITERGSGPLPLPVTGRITSVMGDARGGGRKHAGIDIAVPVGTAVKAPAGGKVVAVWNDTEHGGGLSVRIDHGGGTVSGYAHLSAQDVKVGDEVQPGQIIARSGNTGRSTGPHLHWTMKVGGMAVDPRSAILGGGRTRPPTLDEAAAQVREQLGPDATPEMLHNAQSELATRYRMREEAEKDRSDGVVEAVQAELVRNGGNWFTLPASVRNSVPAKYHPGMIDFATGLRAPDVTRRTDPEAYVALSELAARSPEKFAEINPITYRAQMDDTDWERMVALRSAAIKSGPSSPAMVAHSRIIGVTADLMRLQGLDPGNNEQGNKPANVQKRAQYVTAMSKQVAAWQAINGKDKQPSDDDLKRMGRNLLLEVDDKPVYSMNDTELGRRIADNDRAKAAAALRANGLPITERNIVEIYRRTLAVGGYGD